MNIADYYALLNEKCDVNKYLELCAILRNEIDFLRNDIQDFVYDREIRIKSFEALNKLEEIMDTSLPRSISAFLHGLSSKISSFPDTYEKMCVQIFLCYNYNLNAKELIEIFDLLEETYRIAKNFPKLNTTHYASFITGCEKLTREFKELNKILNLESSMRELSIAKKIYSICRKNVSFVVSLKTPLSGKINVTIRYSPASISTLEIAETMVFLLEGVSKFGSYEKFYSVIESFFASAISDLIRDCPDLFSGVYGKKISFSTFFNIIFEKDASASIGEIRMFSSKMVYIINYDPSFKWMEMNINCYLLKDALFHLKTESFKVALVHEFNHLFDTKGLQETTKLKDLIRVEGISCFAEFAYGKKLPIYDLKAVSRQEISWKERYDVGAFMCFVIYINTLRRQISSGKLPAIPLISDSKRMLEDMDYQKMIFEYPEHYAQAKNVLMILRRLSTEDFFKIFDKYVKELNNIYR